MYEILVCSRRESVMNRGMGCHQRLPRGPGPRLEGAAIPGPGLGRRGQGTLYLICKRPQRIGSPHAGKIYIF